MATASDVRQAAAPSSPQRYHPVAVVLHWLIAVMIVVALALGLYMTGLPLSMQRLRLFNWHKWIGICVLALSVIRLAWRLRHPPPPLPAMIRLAMPRWKQFVFANTHRLLYPLFFIVPISGWTYSSAAGYRVILFGALPLPNLVPRNAFLAEELLKPLHWFSAMALALLILAHTVGATLHLFARDGLFSRMSIKTNGN